MENRGPQVYRMTPEGRYAASFRRREDCPPVPMATCLSKAVNGQETAVKEKHVRSLIIGTYQERGALTFWDCVQRVPLKENPITCWKFCHVLHKVLREGHDKVLRDSQRFKPMLQEHGRFWGHLRTGGYGELVKQYCALLMYKLGFHVRNNRIPGNLEMDEHQLIQSVGDDENALFQLSVEMFDYLDLILDLQAEIFKTIDSRYTSMTNAGQCRLTPLISCIQDSMKLYDFTTKILFRLHSRLSPDLLNGHRDRFLKVFKGLQKFYEKTMSLQYFKTLIEIQNLPKNPPNFLVQAELANYQPSTIKVFNSEPDVTDSQSDTVSEHLVSLDDTNTNGSSSPDPGVMALYLEKERQVKELEGEIERMRLEMQKYKLQANLQFQQLRFEIVELKEQVGDQLKLLAEKDQMIEKLNKHECKPPLDFIRRLDSSEAVSKFAEEKLRATEEKYQRVLSHYTVLRDEHATLLRKHAPVEKELMDIRKAINNQTELGVQVEELRREKAELETTLLAKIDDQAHEGEELQRTIVQLKSQIEDLNLEKMTVQTTLEGKIEEKGQEYEESQEIIVRLKAQLNTVESSKAQLEQQLTCTIEDISEKMKMLEVNRELLEDANRAHLQNLNKTIEDLEAKVEQLTKQLDETSSNNENNLTRAKNLTQQLESFLSDELLNANALLDMHVERVSVIIRSELEDLENPRVGPETGLRDFFMWHCEQFDDVLKKFTDAAFKGFDTPTSLNSIVTEVQALGHKVYFLLTYGGPLSRSGSDIQKGDAFLVEARNFGLSSLDLLRTVKERNVEALRGGSEDLKTKWKKLLELAKSLGVSLSPEADAAEVLDQELHAMEQAIEEAAKKMEEILSQSRASHTGVQLEVNEKLIDSCSSLMNAIRILVQKSKGLQHEIVVQGRGTASAKEFYKRNNQWTEGLISAAKSVGTGATLLLESADKAVTTKGGGFEYLIASSQAIAASTIQLVVASQVRADRSSSNLAQLKQASTGVKTATAHVVATAKDCAQLIEISDEMDMTKLSPHQSKRMELELQAEVLRQESDLEKSRRRLTSLRQHLYHTADG